MPSGPQFRYRRGDRPLPPIRGAESNPPGQPPAGAAAPPANPPAPAADPPKGDEHDPARAKALIDKLRPFEKAAKDLEKERDELAAKLKAHEDAKLSETEKLTKKVADLEASITERDTKHRALLIRAEVERQARTLGIVDEDAAYRLLDLDALAFGDDGAPTNVEKLLKALLEAKPYLKATDAPRPGVPPTPRPNGNAAADKIQENRQKLQATGAYARF